MQWTRDQTNRLIKVLPESRLHSTLVNVENSELDNNPSALETFLPITPFHEAHVDVVIQLSGPTVEAITGTVPVIVIPTVPFTVTSGNIFDTTGDDMSEHKVPLYYVEVGDKQEEFVDELWSYSRYKTSNERNEHV